MNWRSLVFHVLKRLISAQFPRIQWVTSEELAQWLNHPEKPQPMLLDARSEAEYNVSHLQEAQRIDPETFNLAAFTEVSKDKAIVVYCSVGYRSAAVAQKLAEAGFSRVYNLEGSIFQWANEGRPLFQNRHLTTLVHPYNSLWGNLLKS